MGCKSSNPQKCGILSFSQQTCRCDLWNEAYHVILVVRLPPNKPIPKPSLRLWLWQQSGPFFFSSSHWSFCTGELKSFCCVSITSYHSPAWMPGTPVLRREPSVFLQGLPLPPSLLIFYPSPTPARLYPFWTLSYWENNIATPVCLAWNTPWGVFRDWLPLTCHISYKWYLCRKATRTPQSIGIVHRVQSSVTFSCLFLSVFRVLQHKPGSREFWLLLAAVPIFSIVPGTHRGRDKVFRRRGNRFFLFL